MAKKKPANSASSAAQDSDAGANVASPAPETDYSSRRKGATFHIHDRANARRSQLAFHEMNPRTIDRAAFKKLRDFIKKHGLVQSIVVNRRLAANGFEPEQDNTLVIVGGHQRTKAMDDISGYPDKENSDYEVPIDLIQVSPAKEKQLIVALNNPGMMGAWDYDLLTELITSPGVDPLDTGFDRVELATFLDEGALDSILGAAAGKQESTAAPVIDVLNTYAAAGNAAKREAKAATATASLQDGESAGDAEVANADAADSADLADGDSSSAGDGDAVSEDPNSRELLVSRRKQYVDRHKDDASDSFMIVLAANDEQEARSLLRKLELPVDQGFYTLSAFLDRLSDYVQAHAIADLIAPGV